jgi:hypothetical protein
MIKRLAAAAAALFILGCATPAAAQDSVISSLPAATTLGGTEVTPFDQGTCPGTPPACTTVKVTLPQLKAYLAAYFGAGTVTSVAVTVPAWLTPTGCTITAAGTCAITATAESAGQVLAGPTTGSAAASAFRALVAADIPALSYDASGAAATAQSTAEAFSANAANLATGSVATTVGGNGAALPGYLALEISNVDLHTATGDVAHFAFPSTLNDYALNAEKTWGCTASSGSVTMALWTGPAATGTDLSVTPTATTSFGQTSTGAIVLGAGNAGIVAAAHDVYLNVTSDNSTTQLCNVTVIISPLK